MLDCKAKAADFWFVPGHEDAGWSELAMDNALLVHEATCLGDLLHEEQKDLEGQVSSLPDVFLERSRQFRNIPFIAVLVEQKYGRILLTVIIKSDDIWMAKFHDDVELAFDNKEKRLFSGVRILILCGRGKLLFSRNYFGCTNNLQL